MIIACFMSVTFDEHITKITIKNGASGEGEEVDFTTSPVNQVAFPPSGTEIVVYFADGYEYDKTNINFIPTLEEYTYPTQSWDASTQTLTVTGHSDGSGTVAIKSKAIVQKQTIDVSTLSGWTNLATGNHQITIKTKASGYADSAASNAVTVSKAASGYNVTLVYQQHDAPSNADSGSIAYPTVTYSANGETTKHTLTSAGATLQNCTSLSYEAPEVSPDSSYDYGYDITSSNVVVHVNGVTATSYLINITQDTSIIFDVHPCYAVLSGGDVCDPKCCFVAGTKVKTPNGEHTIETLKVGDYITTYNEETKQYEPNKVLRKLINRNVTELATLKLSNGETLQFNAYHPLLTENGYKSLTCHNDLPLLTKEDKLIGGITIEEIVVENLENPIAAYNLLVENNNNFIVNGVIALGKDD